MRGPHDARTGVERDTLRVLRIIQPNHNFADVSSRMGPEAYVTTGTAAT